MVEVVYIQYRREDLERGRQVHEQWKSERPQETHKAIRYVVGFSHDGHIPSDWNEFAKGFPLEEMVKILSQSAPVGWREEYNQWVLKTQKTPHFDEKGHYIFAGYPEEIYKEEEKIKQKLRPASLRYATKDAGKLYKIGTNDMGPNERTLVFYDDVLAAQMRLKNYRDDAVGPDAAPYADLVIKFENGQEIKQNWSAWAPNLQKYLERDIREKLGEDTSSFELFDDNVVRLLKRS